MGKKKSSAEAQKQKHKAAAGEKSRAEETQQAKPQTPLDAEGKIKAMIEKGKKKGYLTYEEMNADLPEELVSPARLDTLLVLLDEMGISLIDEADVDKHGAPAEIAEEDFEPVEAGIPVEPVAEEEPVIEEDKLIEKELVTAEPRRRIDDPVRTYLTQMGEIPLLNRENEISLARKIEVSRMAFRRKMLENDYCAKNSVEILQQVQQGGLSFDRTMKISTAENLIRSVIKKRLPQNLNTINALLAMNQTLLKEYLQAGDIPKAAAIQHRLNRNRRRIATLLEELSLRTSRIAPMKNKLQGIAVKMRPVRAYHRRRADQDYVAEDIDAMKQELAGLQDLICETPAQLDKRLYVIERIFTQYEKTKANAVRRQSYASSFPSPKNTATAASVSWT